MKQAKAESPPTEGQGLQRRKSRTRRSNQMDLSVSGRLRQARLLAGASLGQVGSAIGVTFQAVQKYENGEICLSAGRLAAAAKFLGVPMLFFFADGSEPTSAIDTAGFTAKEIELVRHYRAIASEDMREHLVKLTKGISARDLSGR
jgi:transcriptional regulator with XRE-family HTH domain